MSLLVFLVAVVLAWEVIAAGIAWAVAGRPPSLRHAAQVTFGLGLEDMEDWAWDTSWAVKVLHGRLWVAGRWVEGGWL